MEIPYTVDARPDTGLHNARLGIWLFIASEVMLFGGLVSSYVLLRTGADVWPKGVLEVPLAALNTGVLIMSSMTMVMAWACLRLKAWTRHRMYLGLTVLLGALFLGIKGFEYSQHVRAGELPAHDVFFGLYYTLTGLHALHIAGGLVVMVYLLGPGARLWSRNPEQFINRVEATGLYWHFVDLVWVFLFPMLYLI